MVRSSLTKVWEEVKEIIAPGLSPIASIYYPFVEARGVVMNFEAWEGQIFGDYAIL